MTLRYVFDTGALISAERGKQRTARFLQAVHAGRAQILVPLAVVAEWWRGKSSAREEILAATEIVTSVATAKAAGVALAQLRDVDASLTVDAMVMATAALMDAVVVTGDVEDFDRLGQHFPGVVVLQA